MITMASAKEVLDQTGLLHAITNDLDIQGGHVCQSDVEEIKRWLDQSKAIVNYDLENWLTKTGCQVIDVQTCIPEDTKDHIRKEHGIEALNEHMREPLMLAIWLEATTILTVDAQWLFITDTGIDIVMFAQENEKTLFDN